MGLEGGGWQEGGVVWETAGTFYLLIPRVVAVALG